MAGIQLKKMNWVRSQSAYDSLQTWRAKRQNALAEFESNMATLSSTFNSVWANQINGLGELAANQAMARISAEGQAKINASLKSVDMKA
jgi:hypothetical protein